MAAKYPKTASIVQPRASVKENGGKAARPNASGADIHVGIPAPAVFTPPVLPKKGLGAVKPMPLGMG